LKIQIAAGIDGTQDAKIVARNDYHNLKLPLSVLISGDDGLAGWAIALIVIGSLAAVAVVGYYLKQRSGKRPNRES
jgi:hypothetical protein